MITKHDFERDETRRQVFRKSSSDLACECRHPDPDRAMEGRVPWHWHPEIEIDYVTEGKLVLCTPDQEIHLQRGDAVFVNANSLHMNYWEGNRKAGSFVTILFSQEFLSGMVGGLLERRFMRPVTGSKSLQAYVIRPDSQVHLKMLQNILETYRLFAEEHFAYELMVRSQLTDFWCSLMQETDEIRRRDSRTAEVVSEQIKPMLECINQRYADKLTLDEIAGAGGVSARECNRIFHRYIRMTPMNYVNFYRIRMAAHKLIQTRDSIEQIAQDCGLSSPSYLARLFREEYGCSPREYRGTQKTEDC